MEKWHQIWRINFNVCFWIGVVGCIWMLFKGEWNLVFWAVAQLFMGALLLLILLYPSVWLGKYAFYEGNGNRLISSGIVNNIAIIYNMGLMAFWGYCYMKYYFQRALPDTIIPIFLLAYFTATGPWIYMSNRQEPLSITAVLFLQTAFILSGTILILTKGTRSVAAMWTYLGTMGLGLAVCICMSWFYLGSIVTTGSEEESLQEF